jgi:hypothetical protein
MPSNFTGCTRSSKDVVLRSQSVRSKNSSDLNGADGNESKEGSSNLGSFRTAVLKPPRPSVLAKIRPKQKRISVQLINPSTNSLASLAETGQIWR